MSRFLTLFSCTLLFGVAVSAQSITPQQTDEILKELRAIRQTLERMGQPPLPQPNPPAPAPDEKVKLPDATGVVMGRPDAPVTIIEYTDLQCQFCSRFATETFDLIRKAYIDTGKVRFVTRDYPLPFHPFAMAAARASRCAGEQGRFWELRTSLVKNADKLSADYIIESARTLNLDMAAFASCTTSGRFDAAIQQDLASASAAGVSGTPTFLIGRTTTQGFEGARVVGAQPYALFDAQIQQLLRN